MNDVNKLIVEAIEQTGFGTVIGRSGPYVVKRLEDSDFKAFSQFIKKNKCQWDIKHKRIWDLYGPPFYYFEKDGELFGLLHFRFGMFTSKHRVIDPNKVETDAELWTLMMRIIDDEEPETTDINKYWLKAIKGETDEPN